MKNIIKASTKDSPYVNIDYSMGIIELKGRSVQENPLEFYNTLRHDFKKIIDSQSFTVTLNFQFEHFNTSSSKCIYNILRQMKDMHSSQQKNIRINWFYDNEDEDMKEVGEDYQELTGLGFRYIAV